MLDTVNSISAFAHSNNMRRVSERARGHAARVLNVLYSAVSSRPSPRSRCCDSVSIRNPSRRTPGIKVVGWQVGRYESIRLFKQVVTSSKSGLWDEVAVTQIRSLTSPYLRALWPPSVPLPPAIVTPDSAHSHRHRRGYLSASAHLASNTFRAGRD